MCHSDVVSDVIVRALLAQNNPIANASQSHRWRNERRVDTSISSKKCLRYKSSLERRLSFGSRLKRFSRQCYLLAKYSLHLKSWAEYIASQLFILECFSRMRSAERFGNTLSIWCPIRCQIKGFMIGRGSAPFMSRIQTHASLTVNRTYSNCSNSGTMGMSMRCHVPTAISGLAYKCEVRMFSFPRSCAIWAAQEGL
jgi:hypothetical protein